jgi:hypothetical protein
VVELDGTVGVRSKRERGEKREKKRKINMGVWKFSLHG